MKLIKTASRIWSEVFRRVIVLLAVVLMASMTAKAKEWRGIKPAHSTRSDVERIIGAASGSCKCRYKLDQESVDIFYAHSTCSQNPYGWNLPVDTVVEITVTPKVRVYLSTLQIDTSKFERQENAEQPQKMALVNEADGVWFEMVKLEGDREWFVGHANYRPAKADEDKLCSNSVYKDKRYEYHAPYSVLKEFGNTQERVTLASFGSEMVRSDSQGYILYYSGKTKKQMASARHQADRAESLIIKDHPEILRKQLTVRYGGFKKQIQVVLFLVPKGSSPPFIP